MYKQTGPFLQGRIPAANGLGVLGIEGGHVLTKAHPALSPCIKHVASGIMLHGKMALLRVGEIHQGYQPVGCCERRDEVVIAMCDVYSHMLIDTHAHLNFADFKAAMT